MKPHSLEVCAGTLERSARSLPQLIGLVVLSIIFLTGTARAASTLYGVNGSHCGCFFSVDLSSGHLTEIGRIAKDWQPTGMAVAPDGTIYVVMRGAYTNSSSLAIVDEATGAGDPFGYVSGVCSSLAIAPVSVPGPSGMLPAGTFFAHREMEFSNDHLIIINEFGGEETIIAGTNRFYFGLEFRADGVLFGAGLAPSGAWELATINTATGEESVIGELVAFPAFVGALVFQPTGELLVSVLGEEAAIWEVDQSTAELSNPRILEGCCGDFPQGMGFVGAPTSIESATWGRIKESYREPHLLERFDSRVRSELAPR